MKKGILSLLLVLACSLILVACGKDDKTEEAQPVEPKTSETGYDYVQKNADPFYVVALEEEPENVKNVKAVLLNSADGSAVRTCAYVHEEDDGTYIIKFFGM